MPKQLVFRVVALVGAALLAGCGVSGSVTSQKHHQDTAAGGTKTPDPTAPMPSPRSTSPASANGSTSLGTAPATTAAPVVVGTAGALETNTAWPLSGAPVIQQQTANAPTMTIQHFSRKGFVIDGAHWSWPSSDTNPGHYLVVPAVVGGKPYLVWSHLGAETGTEGTPNVNQPATLWMTPWNPDGGSLASHAIVVTNDIPPVWSQSGRWDFASPVGKIPAMAENAWTGWFRWGRVAKPYMPRKGPTGKAQTVAWPIQLDPAFDGIVLVVETHLAGANQGFAANVYYLNLVRHTVTGLASLSNGGGLFLGLGIWNGLVVDEEATDLTRTSALLAYNEVTGRRQSIPSHGTTLSGSFTVVGQQLREAGTTIANVTPSLSTLYGPTPNPFPTSSWTYASVTNHGPNGSFTVSIPQQFAAAPPPTDHDGRTWRHGSATITAFSEVNAAHAKLAYPLNPKTTNITYEAKGPHWRVASGIEGSSIVYAKVYFMGSDIFWLKLTYPEADQDQYSSMVARVANSFVPSVKP